LALVITELIHNALEHGLESTGDELRVEVDRAASACSVRIIDNGVGLPRDFDWDASSNLGLQIVKTLTENELKGSINLVRKGDETVATLTFKA
jgi:two-component sensor histidine kinase